MSDLDNTPEEPTEQETTEAPSESDGKDYLADANNRAASRGGSNKPSPADRLNQAKNIILRNKKGIGIAGGIGGSILILASSFPLIVMFKLVFIRENLVEFFDKRQEHSIERRIGQHYRLVFDKDGSIKGRQSYSGNFIYNKIVNFKTEKLAADLKSKGVNAEFNSRGTLVSFNGQPLKDVNFSDRRSLVRQTLKETYPELGWWRRGTRARQLYRYYGIRLRFFENTREKLGNKAADVVDNLKKKMRQSLFGDDSNTATARSGDTTNEDDKKKTNDLSDKINEQANAIRQDALENPKKPFNIDTAGIAKKAANAGATGVKGALKGALLGPMVVVGDLCGIKDLLNGITTGAKYFRALSLARYAGIVLTAADSIKRGQVQPEELNAFMKNFEGFEKSGGWQWVTGKNNPNITTGDKFSVNGQLTGSLLTVNEKVEQFGATKRICPFATNFIVQGGAMIISLISEVASDGATALGLAALGAAGEEVKTYAISLVEPMLIQMVAGMTVTGDEPPAELGDAMVAGYDVIANGNARTNGGHPLTTQEVTQLNYTVALEDAEDVKHQSIAYRLFNLNNQKSLASQIVMATPSSWHELGSRAASSLAVLNPQKMRNVFSQVASTIKNNSPQAQAEATATDPFGVDQYGFVDGDMDQYPDILANEAYINRSEDSKKKYEEFVSNCINPETSDPDSLATTQCTDRGPEATRMRVYHFDIGLMDMVSSYNQVGANTQ